MSNVATLEGLVPDRLAPKARKIVLEDYCLPVDIGFHDFEIGTPHRLFVTVELWGAAAPLAAEDDATAPGKSDFLRTENGRFVEGGRCTLSGKKGPRGKRSCRERGDQ